MLKYLSSTFLQGLSLVWETKFQISLCQGQFWLSILEKDTLLLTQGWENAFT